MDPIGRLPVWPGEDRMISVWQAVGSCGSRGLREERQCSRCATEKERKAEMERVDLMSCTLPPVVICPFAYIQQSVWSRITRCLCPVSEQVRKWRIGRRFERSWNVRPGLSEEAPSEPTICNGFWCHYYVKWTKQTLIKRWQIWKHQTFLPEKCVLIT